MQQIAALMETVVDVDDDANAAVLKYRVQ